MKQYSTSRSFRSWRSHSSRRGRLRPGRTGGVLVAVALAVAGCTSADPEPEAPTGSLEPGALLTSAELSGAAVLPSAARNELVTYLSDGAEGDPVVVSGTVAVPPGSPPEGGWPVVSWAHGTTGVADACAPSAATAGGPIADYVTLVGDTLDAWVRAGFVVVATDYEGLGTPGGHPYMHGDSAAASVVDIVRAARQLHDSVGTDWVVLGHSQGGQAAIFTAAHGSARAPELQLRGAVAMAPGNDTDLIPELTRAGDPRMAPGLPFLPLVLLGAEAADPRIVPEDLLSDAALPLLETARSGCLAALREVPPIPVTEVFQPDADLGPLLELLRAQQLSTVVPQVPTLVVQGTADQLVASAGTEVAVAGLCESGAPMSYRTYDGVDHRGVIADSLGDVEEFVAARLADEPAGAGAC